MASSEPGVSRGQLQIEERAATGHPRPAAFHDRYDAAARDFESIRASIYLQGVDQGGFEAMKTDAGSLATTQLV
jgi:hypothetical protein